MKIAAPNGVDVFIDSVGGIFFQHVINRMARNGRICLLGNLARYNHKRRTPEDDDEEEEEQALGSRMLDMDIALKVCLLYVINFFANFCFDSRI